MKSRKRKRRSRPRDEASYVCPTCGESIVVPVDPSGGAEQQYVEDCPVCCNPNVIHVEFVEEGEAPRVWANAE
jgi:Cysteine-rich CPXCG